MIRKQIRNRRGSTLVDTSLILVTFVMTMIGVFDVGTILFTQQTLVERAQRAARYGTVNPFDATAVQNIVLYNQPSIPVGGTPIFGLEAANVSVQRLDGGSANDRVVVLISGFNVRIFTPYISKTIKGIPIRVSLSYENF